MRLNALLFICVVPLMLFAIALLDRHVSRIRPDQLARHRELARQRLITTLKLVERSLDVRLKAELMAREAGKIPPAPPGNEYVVFEDTVARKGLFTNASGAFWTVSSKLGKGWLVAAQRLDSVLAAVAPPGANVRVALLTGTHTIRAASVEAASWAQLGQDLMGAPRRDVVTVPVEGATEGTPRWALVHDFDVELNDKQQVLTTAALGCFALTGIMFLLVNMWLRRCVIIPLSRVHETMNWRGPDDATPPEMPIPYDFELATIATAATDLMFEVRDLRASGKQRVQEEAERQRVQLVALQQLEFAQFYISNNQNNKALDHLCQITSRLGKISQQARLLRIELFLKEGQDVALEEELEKGSLSEIPPRVLRQLTQRLEEVGRYDLAAECLREVASRHPGKNTLEQQLARLEDLSSVSKEGSSMMRVARRSLGNLFTHVRYLNAGGMGMVLRAQMKDTGATIAIKLLPPSLAGNVEVLKRLKREIASLQQLDHPNVIKILGSIEGEIPGYYMEFLEGEDLANYLTKTSPLPIEQVCTLGIMMLEGLHHAHSRSIIHRDVKPGNFVLLTDGSIRLVDFGLAKIGQGTDVTKTGTSMGTPGYMSPEQIKGATECGEEVDVYAIGVVLYEMLTGSRPFPDDMDPINRLVQDAPSIALKMPNLPPELIKVVDGCLERRGYKRTIRCPEIIEILQKIKANAETATEPAGEASGQDQSQDQGQG